MAEGRANIFQVLQSNLNCSFTNADAVRLAIPVLDQGFALKEEGRGSMEEGQLPNYFYLWDTSPAVRSGTGLGGVQGRMGLAHTPLNVFKGLGDSFQTRKLLPSSSFLLPSI